jgi:hypothetical protein
MADDQRTDDLPQIGAKDKALTDTARLDWLERHKRLMGVPTGMTLREAIDEDMQACR